MRFPKLKPAAQKRTLITAFRGYEHVPSVSPGAFYDMQNLSGDPSPLLRVRRRRTEVPELDDNPANAVNTLGGRGTPTLLDNYGTLWCGGHPIPRLLDGTPGLAAEDEAGQSVTIRNPQAVYAILVTPGSYSFVYDEAADKWRGQEGQGDLDGSVFAPLQAEDEMLILVQYSYTPARSLLRELVFMGSWVCVFPDGKYANTAKLRAGEELQPEEDYGSIALSNSCGQGGTVFEPCGADGTLWNVTWSDTPPASGYWVDTTEAQPTVRVWSQSQSLWLEVSPYVKCSIPGIARGLRPGDCVELTGRLDTSQGGEDEVEALWSGVHMLAEACHDPGDGNRAEGAGDYLIIPGLISQRWEIELSWHDQSWLSAARSFPVMDFVVEAGNRLWGCRFGDGVNELYGSKLGDFRNWYAFEGLSTDSYSVARGHDGPYLFVLDTQTGFWYKEDILRFRTAYSDGEQLYYTSALGGSLYCIGSADDSQGVVWWAETGDLIPRMALRRYVTRIQVKAKPDLGSELRVYVSYDGDTWQKKGTLPGGALKCLTFSVFSRRSGGVRLRLEGTGGMELHSLSWLTEGGSDV